MHFTYSYLCVSFTIYWNRDVISLSETIPGCPRRIYIYNKNVSHMTHLWLTHTRTPIRSESWPPVTHTRTPIRSESWPPAPHPQDKWFHGLRLSMIFFSNHIYCMAQWNCQNKSTCICHVVYHIFKHLWWQELLLVLGAHPGIMLFWETDMLDQSLCYI